MMAFEVFCRAKKQSGCTWKGPLSKLEDHLNGCQLVLVNCYHNCGKHVLRKDLNQHTETECLYRKSPCEHCKDAVVWNEVEKHFESCSKYPQQCDKCEEEGIERDKMKLHLEQHCPNVKRKCPFNLLGCKFEGLQSDREKHVKEEFSSHVQDMVEKFATLRDEMEVTRNASKQTRDGTKGETESPTEKQAGQIQRLEGEVDGLKHNVNELNNKVYHLELQLKEADVIMRKQKIKLLQQEGCYCYGMYTWMIENLTLRIQDAISGVCTVMYSPSFHTSPCGYKLCLRINLNGVESGVGTHVALYVHVMRGDYDGFLEWPFSKGFRLSIVDQSEDVESRHHISKTVVAEPELNAFQRPVAPFNTIGFGYQDFTPIEKIHEPQYTKNNTLLVKFEIID